MWRMSLRSFCYDESYFKLFWIIKLEIQLIYPHLHIIV